MAGLLTSGEEVAAQWAASIYTLLVTVPLAVDMIRAAVRGRLGIDLLAVAAVASTVAVGEYIASLIVVLMQSGGGALEDPQGVGPDRRTGHMSQLDRARRCRMPECTMTAVRRISSPTGRHSGGI